MKKIEFKLVNPVRLIPVTGDSYVSVETNGSVTIQDPVKVEPREPRYRTLIDTGKAQLKLSAHGLYRKVVIRLRADEATQIDFQREMNTLFEA